MKPALYAFSLFGFALFLAGASSAVKAGTAPASPAVQLVQKLGDTALMSLTGKDINRATREKRVREILRNNFDLETIGRFAMGTYWREASDAQKTEYMDLFEDMIVQTYTSRFEDYSGQTLKVGTAVESGSKDVLVSSQVVQKNGPPVNLEWRVRDKDGVLKVIDVVVEGVSMSVTQRSDFSAVIQRGGGSIEALLSSLRERRKSVANQKI